jgi:flagellum-specific peptidoglycan hydrolase FlgJ
MVADEVKNWPADHRRVFLAELAPAALENALLHQVPPSVTMAQAALESGWGRSGLAQQHNNLFGVKAGSSSAAVALPTRETVGGTSRTQRERFRTYDSWSESLAHHGALLSGDERYAHARDDWHDWRTFLNHVAPVYATDPRYAHLVGSIVNRYGLDRWDDLVVEAAATSRLVEPGELGEDGSPEGI